MRCACDMQKHFSESSSLLVMCLCGCLFPSGCSRAARAVRNPGDSGLTGATDLVPV